MREGSNIQIHETRQCKIKAFNMGNEMVSSPPLLGQVLEDSHVLVFIRSSSDPRGKLFQGPEQLCMYLKLALNSFF